MGRPHFFLITAHSKRPQVQTSPALACVVLIWGKATCPPPSPCPLSSALGKVNLLRNGLSPRGWEELEADSNFEFLGNGEPEREDLLGAGSELGWGK